MHSRVVTSPADVIEAAGGTAAVAELTGRKPQHVSNWKASETLPPKTYIVLSRELEKRGITAPLSVWGMIEPERAAS